MKVQSVVAFLTMALLSASALAHQPYGAAAEIPASASSCAATSTTLCLRANRFRVEVVWNVPPHRPSGVGKAVSLTGDTGYFWFFSADDAELVIKIFGSNSFAVFYSALSDIEYTITVTDTATGKIRTYFNPNGNLASVLDTNAFVYPPVNAPPFPPSEEGASKFASRPAYPAGDEASPEPATTCTASPTTLCLNSGRFQVQVAWLVPRNPYVYGSLAGTSGTGNGVPLTDHTGYFWFFSKDSVELVIKILDGRTINGAYWVFVGPLSNVEYVITVTDMQTGTIRTYWNAPEQIASIGDTEAFGEPRPVWRRLAAGPNGKPVSALAVDPLSGDLYAPNGNAPDGGGVSRLAVGASNWVPTSEPFSRGVSKVVIAPTDPPTIYAIATRSLPTPETLQDDALFGSKDLGRTWTPLLHSVAAVAVDPSRPERVYAGGIGPGELVYAIGVYKTENGGLSWASSKGNFPCRALAISPSDPATIYAGSTNSGDNIFSSADAGATWTSVLKGYDNVRTIAVDPVSPSLVYAVAFRYISSGVLRSTDAGATWSFFAFPGYVSNPVVVDPFSRSVFVGGDGGVLRSDDEGEHWTPFNDGLSGFSILSLAIGPRQTLYAGTEGAVFAVPILSRPNPARPARTRVPPR